MNNAFSDALNKPTREKLIAKLTMESDVWDMRALIDTGVLVQLRSGGLNTLQSLFEASDAALLKVRRLGPLRLKEIRQVLQEVRDQLATTEGTTEASLVKNQKAEHGSSAEKNQETIDSSINHQKESSPIILSLVRSRGFTDLDHVTKMAQQHLILFEKLGFEPIVDKAGFQSKICDYRDIADTLPDGHELKEVVNKLNHHLLRYRVSPSADATATSTNHLTQSKAAGEDQLKGFSYMANVSLLKSTFNYQTRELDFVFVTDTGEPYQNPMLIAFVCQETTRHLGGDEPTAIAVKRIMGTLNLLLSAMMPEQEAIIRIDVASVAIKHFEVKER